MTSPERADLSTDERRLYDLVCRRLLTCWHEDHVWSVTTVITAITNGAMVDRYYSSGKAIQQAGWKVLDIQTEKQKSRGKKAKAGSEEGVEDEQQALPAGLERGQAQDVLDAEVLRKKTRAPKRFTEATLLTAMETAGKTLDEKELSEAMKETGLGTPATRASIIEVLLKREYIVRSGKNLEATDKGIQLIEVVHPEVKSPAMTGHWEAYLKRIQRGEAQLEPFMHGIEDYVRDVIGKVGGVSAGPRVLKVAAPKERDGTLGAALDRFGFKEFRAHQEETCRHLIEGRDVLLVMPAGAGKSACWQMAGFARGGTTLVMSPQIAVMEERCRALREGGFTANCIHSGRDRESSRRICIEYLSGGIQFLFVEPERLEVPGFPAMLAKRKPVLIAIEEAHCISQKAAGFRPDYQLLTSFVALVRPAPVLAMSVKAAVAVRRDIALGLCLEQPEIVVSRGKGA